MYCRSISHGSVMRTSFRFSHEASGELFPDPLDGNEQNEASNDVQGKLIRVVTDPESALFIAFLGFLVGWCVCRRSKSATFGPLETQKRHGCEPQIFDERSANLPYLEVIQNSRNKKSENHWIWKPAKYVKHLSCHFEGFQSIVNTWMSQEVSKWLVSGL